jgi:glycosyltransferase involved in cell wall biosynthesis
MPLSGGAETASSTFGLQKFKMDKVRLLFQPSVDAGNTNAQSLNVRELALRFDPERFDITLWYEVEPDARLVARPGIRLMKLPARRKSLKILREMLNGYDIIAYMDYSPASYLFLHLPHGLRRRTTTVYHAEAPAAQLVNPPRMLKFLYDGIYPRCDAYTGITDYVARDLQVRLNRKITLILPVGVETALFTPPAQRANPVPVILFAGTLIERKRPQYLIDAAARFPNATFRLVGAGRDGFDETLRQKIARSNLKNITLDGPRSQAQLRDIMRSSDIFVLPSRLEGIPKVTLEAAATGLPCVVFRDYETPSVVDGVTGFQVGTIEEMVKALGRLITDPSLRQQMGTAARKHVAQFDWDLVSRQWENAYLEIAAAKGNH